MALPYRLAGIMVLFFFLSLFTYENLYADYASDNVYKIGVLAYKGKDSAIKRWSAHEYYLNKKLSPLQFKIIPLSYKNDELTKAVINRKVDFVITNPGHFTELQLGGYVSHLATRRIRGELGILDQFGGTAISLPDRVGIKRYVDLKGKKILIPSKHSLGGWQVHLREAISQGVDLRQQAEIIELKNHRKVVNAILSGQADVGFVRSDLIEGMVQNKELKLEQLKIVNQRYEKHYPYLLSTRLYPEWPFAVVKGVSKELSVMVLKALLELAPDSLAAQQAKIYGWTISGNYGLINELYLEAKLGQYGHMQHSFNEIFEEYRVELFIFLIIVTSFLIINALRTHRVNRSLKFEIIERKLAENRLLTLSMAVEQSPNSVIITDIKGGIQYVNSAFEKSSGYRASEVIGQNPRILKSTNTPADVYIALWETISKGKLWEGEIENCKKDGEHYWEYEYISPVMDDMGEITHFVAVKKDITQDKALNNQLQQEIESNQKYHETLSYQNNLNKYLKQLLKVPLLGRELDECLKDSLEVILSTPFAGLLSKGAIFLVIDNKKELKKNELKLTVSINLSTQLLTLCDKVAFGHCLCGRAAQDKKIIHAHCIDDRHDISFEGIQEHGHYNVPIIREDEVTGVLVLYLSHGHEFSDIEEDFLASAALVLASIIEQKQTEKSLLLAKETAENATKVKSEFLANMSHEIRTPMNAITGLTTLVLKTEINDKQKNYLLKTQGAVDNLLRIINDILDFSKIESGKLEMESVAFNVEAVVENACDLLMTKAIEKGIKILIKGLESVPKTLVGDPTRLGQVLLNLGSNAVKFTGDAGKIELSIIIKNESDKEILIQFSISDTGIGIPQEHQKNIFQSFSQADNSITRQFGGTGLGLVISKSIVNLMGGEIGFDSQASLGSTFYFTACFKKADKDLEAISTIKDRSINASIDRVVYNKLKGINVLLVEDIELNQEIATEFLNSADINVTVANNGQESLDILEHQTFDLVLMDCQMPIMDGYTATKNIRKQGCFDDLPIIAMTANAMNEDIKKCLEVGMNDHISKPIREQLMFSTMAKWVKTKDDNSRVELVTDQPELSEQFELPDSPKQAEQLDLYFSDLPGISFSKSTMKKAEMFQKYLFKFSNQYSDFEDNYKKALNGDDKTVPARLAHGLKGLSGTLGMIKLQHLASLLEKANIDNPTEIDDLFTSTMDELDIILKSIKISEYKNNSQA